MMETLVDSLRTLFKVALTCLFVSPLFLLLTPLLLGPLFGWLMALSLPPPVRGDWQTTAAPSTLEAVKRLSTHHSRPTAGTAAAPGGETRP